MKVWDGETGQVAFNLARDSQPVYSLAPSPDGRYLASGSLGGKISIWALGKGELVSCFGIMIAREIFVNVCVAMVVGKRHRRKWRYI